MPATTTNNPPKQRSLLRFIAIVILTLIILVGVAVLITWLIVRPKRLVYTIEDPSIKDYKLNNNHLNATFEFFLRSYNPNTRVSVYYDSIEVSIAFNDQTVAFNTIDPFRQPRRNVTRMEAKVVAENLALAAPTARDLNHDKAVGKVELDVYVKARIRVKVGIWKSRHRTLRLVCSPVIVFSSSKNFESRECDQI
ncbi:uncharacterized protein At1g08160 [Carica papaya]|uniref:uncharacterized protein At1g08160 n=1 Tax=Carica papaya TaxID=3649 RepID=UPI000B8D0652|nr:uncharacterized protein At1g08160 [Carica papaya]